MLKDGGRSPEPTPPKDAAAEAGKGKETDPPVPAEVCSPPTFPFPAVKPFRTSDLSELE